MTADALAPAYSPSATDRRAKARRKRLLFKALEITVLVAVAIVVVFPIAWMVMTAFKDPRYVYERSCPHCFDVNASRDLR